MAVAGERGRRAVRGALMALRPFARVGMRRRGQRGRAEVMRRKRQRCEHRAAAAGGARAHVGAVRGRVRAAGVEPASGEGHGGWRASRGARVRARVKRVGEWLSATSVMRVRTGGRRAPRRGAAAWRVRARAVCGQARSGVAQGGSVRRVRERAGARSAGAGHCGCAAERGAGSGRARRGGVRERSRGGRGRKEGERKKKKEKGKRGKRGKRNGKREKEIEKKKRKKMGGRKKKKEGGGARQRRLRPRSATRGVRAAEDGARGRRGKRREGKRGGEIRGGRS